MPLIKFFEINCNHIEKNLVLTIYGEQKKIERLKTTILIFLMFFEQFKIFAKKTVFLWYFNKSLNIENNVNFYFR